MEDTIMDIEDMNIEDVNNLIDELNLRDCVENKLSMKKMSKIFYDMSTKWQICYEVLTDKQIEIKNICEKRRKELGLPLLKQNDDKQICDYNLMLKKIVKAKSILKDVTIRNETQR